MSLDFELTISYDGALSSENLIDFYDVSQALIGFQRSLALTTHLVLNNEIITQSPSLKGARILAMPPEAGSWKFAVYLSVLGSGIYGALTAEQNTVLGHLVTSAYDYVISESLGFHVDFSKTLGQQFEEFHKDDHRSDVNSESRFDSLIEKCEPAITQMHRPIVESKTANSARLFVSKEGELVRIGQPLDEGTYDFIRFSSQSDNTSRFTGRISSYNVNTFKGRVYIPSENRPIPFLLAEQVRDSVTVSRITGSLSLNALSRSSNSSLIRFDGFRFETRHGRLKSILITAIE